MTKVQMKKINNGKTTEQCQRKNHQNREQAFMHIKSYNNNIYVEKDYHTNTGTNKHI